VGSEGYALPKGAWIVDAGANSVVMFFPPPAIYNQPRHQMGTGRLPGQQQWMTGPCTPPPCKRPTHDQYLEAWRAWQRKTGWTGSIRPLPGRVPPNFAGWQLTSAPSSTLLSPGQSGIVLADGQNVVIMGAGASTITQAFSV
jgi:hypothetical protein